jgi:threonine/homoserine/homoserine lactone efflux protein
MTLVISETLQHGSKEGLKIAMVPVISDFPIVTASLFILSRFQEADLILAVLALAGAAYLIYLGIENIRFKGKTQGDQNEPPRSFRKGIITNFLNPNPYIFWITVGAPTVLRAHEVNLLSAILFVVFMYTFLVGSKILTAIITGRSRNFLKSRGYILTIRFLGAMLILFALVFINQGLRSLNLY